MKKDFEMLPHTADLKIRAYGKDLKELFCNAVKGMFKSITPIFDGERESVREFSVSSHDLESLLVDFLSEALYLSDVHNEAYLDARITEISEQKIVGTLVGTKVKDFEAGEIKAVTHHGLRVKKEDDIWSAEILFDL